LITPRKILNGFFQEGLGFEKTYLGETALAILADKVGTGSRYPAPVGCAPVLSIVGHNGEHFGKMGVSRCAFRSKNDNQILERINWFSSANKEIEKKKIRKTIVVGIKGGKIRTRKMSLLVLLGRRKKPSDIQTRSHKPFFFLSFFFEFGIVARLNVF
jgi:hypothetical protein